MTRRESLTRNSAGRAWQYIPQDADERVGCVMAQDAPGILAT